MNLFAPKTPPNAAKVEEIRAWITGRFRLADDVIVLVSELRCSEPGCPPLETVIAIMAGPGQCRQFKVHKSVAAISDADLEALDVGED